MPIRISFRRPNPPTYPDLAKAALAELISTFIFVFAATGSAVAFNQLTNNAATNPTGLISSAIAHAFAFFVSVSVAANLSGGHVNPAVTFGAYISGNISILGGIAYIIAQLLGSIVACSLLKLATGGQSIPAFGLSAGVQARNAVVIEMVMTFGLVFTEYATAVDPKRGSSGTIAPIAIGFLVGANILAGGAFDGASMNPALSFGPAVVGWKWANHWVYWIGPLIGGGAAGFAYETAFIHTSRNRQQPK